MPEVSVCVCTFRRPELLDGLLSLLAEQRLPAFEIVVVDNDPAHSALPVLQAWGERLPLRFVHLPEPNIAKARNLAVAQARGAWLAFIDDDERPGPDWLYLLVQAQAASGADGVMAPVLPNGLRDFAERVLPELRRRGLARTEYDGATLRANLGLQA